MSQQELLTRVIETLDRAGIDYMLTGSLVSSLQGDPRATHDIDLVVALTVASAQSLIQEFPSRALYLDELSVRDAIARGDMFNLLDADTGDKVDFWLLTDDPFDQSRFARKVTENVNGFLIKLSRAEDTILMKLKWSARSGGSEKQYQDALSVYELQFPSLDQTYLDLWSKTLGVWETLSRLRAQAKPL